MKVCDQFRVIFQPGTQPAQSSCPMKLVAFSPPKALRPMSFHRCQTLSRSAEEFQDLVKKFWSQTKFLRNLDSCGRDRSRRHFLSHLSEEEISFPPRPFERIHRVDRRTQLSVANEPWRHFPIAESTTWWTSSRKTFHQLLPFRLLLLHFEDTKRNAMDAIVEWRESQDAETSVGPFDSGTESALEPATTALVTCVEGTTRKPLDSHWTV